MMRIVHTLVLSMAVILNFIDLSSQFDCLPNGAPIRDVSRFEPSDIVEPSHPPAESSSRATSRSRPPAKPALRSRSNLPPGTHSYLHVLGYEPDELRFLRLIPIINPNRQYQIQRYTFPGDKLIYVRGRSHVRLPLPTGEHAVLSTSDGYVFALVEDDKYLRAIYLMRNEFGDEVEKRVKIKMSSGAVEDMTPNEIKESPCGNHRRISASFSSIMVDEHP